MGVGPGRLEQVALGGGVGGGRIGDVAGLGRGQLPGGQRCGGGGQRRERLGRVDLTAGFADGGARHGGEPIGRRSVARPPPRVAAGDLAGQYQRRGGQSLGRGGEVGHRRDGDRAVATVEQDR